MINQLNSWSSVLVKLVTQLVKKFPSFMEPQGAIIVFTRARHWCLSWARWIQYTPSHPPHLEDIS